MITSWMTSTSRPSSASSRSEPGPLLAVMPVVMPFPMPLVIYLQSLLVPTRPPLLVAFVLRFLVILLRIGSMVPRMPFTI
eukprot:9151841-Pyramimonas_sp.AAC.1